ncbi:MAG: magnesium/cobalt transporter CorA [Nitrolancea sp.]
MINLQLLDTKKTDAKVVAIDQLDGLVGDPNSLLWVDLIDPTPEDFKRITQEFNFHPLALEDAQKRHQRPKIDVYENFFFLVFYAVREIQEGADFTTQEVAFFIGSNYLVTVHHGMCAEIEGTVRRWRENVPRGNHAGPAILLYSILDSIVDNYFPVLDSVAERTDELEQRIFDSEGHEALELIFQLRKNLLALRRILAPERDMMSIVARRDVELLGEETSIYFQDVYDHVLRVTDAIDTYRDLLSGALDAYLSVTSNKLNQVMRTLTSWSIILMSLALIAGIYGMNFIHMPELRLTYGYYASLLGMFALGALLFAWFKKIDWL